MVVVGKVKTFSTIFLSFCGGIQDPFYKNRDGTLPPVGTVETVFSFINNGCMSTVGTQLGTFTKLYLENFTVLLSNLRSRELQIYKGGINIKFSRGFVRLWSSPLERVNRLISSLDMAPYTQSEQT